MKILVFTALYPNNVWPNHGIFIKERVAAVANSKKCAIRVVAPVPYYPPIKLGWRSGYRQVARREIVDGIEVDHPRYFMIPKIAMALQGWLMFLSVLPAVKRIQKQFDFDLIDAHYVYPDGLAAVLLGRILAKPVVVSARGSDINLFARLPIIRRILCYTLTHASHLITVSHALQNAITELGISAEKISVIPNGVDTGKFRRVDKQFARRSLGLPADCPVLLSVGGLTAVKGFDLLLRAFKIIHEQARGNKPRLVIVGEGALRGKLTELISELALGSHVSLVGAVPHEQLYAWYNAADVFCLASEREGWPNVILEALACGIPVVATPVGGVPEILVNEEIGFLTERKPAEMAARMREAMEKNWDSDGIARYAASLTWIAAATKICAVFDSVLQHPAAQGRGCASVRAQRPI